MYIIMGGRGRVGSATAEALLSHGEQVTIVTRDATRAGAWRMKGAGIAEANVNDVASLRAAFRRGSRAFLLNPLADIAADTNAVERRTVANILSALEGSGLEKVVAESTAGAQPGDRIGDLNVLWELEEGLRRQPIPAAINRAAYYMSNWDGLLDVVRKTGKLPTMLPAELAIPMAAPRDLGEVAYDVIRRTRLKKYKGVMARWLRRTLSATDVVSESDLASYVLFDPEYIAQLIDLGYNDAAKHHAELTALWE